MKSRPSRPASDPRRTLGIGARLLVATLICLHLYSCSDTPPLPGNAVGGESTRGTTDVSRLVVDNTNHGTDSAYGIPRQEDGSVVQTISSKSPLRDLDFLEQYPQLKTLTIQYCPKLSDFSGLNTVPTLESLHILHSDLHGLAGMRGLPNLKQFGLWYDDSLASLAGLENLAGDSLRSIRLVFGAQLRDISAIRKFTGLHQLELQGLDRLTDVSAISDLVNLEDLTLADCPIRDVSGLGNLQQLKHLHLLRLTQLNDGELGFIKSLPQLKSLRIESNSWIKDFAFLATQAELERLELYDCGIESIASLKSQKHIQFLGLGYCRNITDHTPLYDILSKGDTLNTYGYLTEEYAGVVDSLKRQGVIVTP